MRQATKNCPGRKACWQDIRSIVNIRKQSWSRWWWRRRRRWTLKYLALFILFQEYLSQKKFIHRDLATRNILVCDDHLVKISDFGLTRDVYESCQYQKAHTAGKLPIKWMAIESLFDNVYTTESDVWSYGILLWELITLGSSPYPGVAGRDIHKLIKNGYRMDKPENCSQQMYQLMLSCWAANAEDRPSFTDLRNDLEEMLEADDELYISVNCDDFDYYCTLANNLDSSSEVEEERLMSPMSNEAHHYVWTPDNAMHWSRIIIYIERTELGQFPLINFCPFNAALALFIIINRQKLIITSCIVRKPCLLTDFQLCVCLNFTLDDIQYYFANI